MSYVSLLQQHLPPERKSVVFCLFWFMLSFGDIQERAIFLVCWSSLLGQEEHCARVIVCLLAWICLLPVSSKHRQNELVCERHGRCALCQHFPSKRKTWEGTVHLNIGQYVRETNLRFCDIFWEQTSSTSWTYFWQVPFLIIVSVSGNVGNCWCLQIYTCFSSLF